MRQRTKNVLASLSALALAGGALTMAAPAAQASVKPVLVYVEASTKLGCQAKLNSQRAYRAAQGGSPWVDIPCSEVLYSSPKRYGGTFYYYPQP
ncbi:hypothetical protein [Citricoccus sp. NR2]|uniref:hypothetical protein n=1 Tax=Citricoccus sp. NR2 TaxID=3004095 RepID=UPI0022DD8AF2|nr:hypothetical protein [Citricoccus sp. NR2]WBL20216.1 hypothetical protein O1A05_05915 [Citricoccus sp. NR2]